MHPSLPFTLRFIRSRPRRRQHLGLLKYRLHGRILKVGRVAIPAQNALDQHPHPGTGWLPAGPVNRHATAQAGQQLMSDQPELVVSHDLHRAFVLGQGVIESDLLL